MTGDISHEELSDRFARALAAMAHEIRSDMRRMRDVLETRIEEKDKAAVLGRRELRESFHAAIDTVMEEVHRLRETVHKRINAVRYRNGEDSGDDASPASVGDGVLVALARALEPALRGLLRRWSWTRIIALVVAIFGGGGLTWCAVAPRAAEAAAVRVATPRPIPYLGAVDTTALGLRSADD